MQNSYVKITEERFIIDMMYARSDNMIGRSVYKEIGWGNLAVVHIDLMERLRCLLPILKKEKMKLKICDAYRPSLAHNLMKNIIPMKGFFADYAEKSQHCLGTAVDVCLCDENGKEFSYPTKVDAYKREFCEQVLRGEFEEFSKYLQKARQDYFEEGMELEIKNRQFLRDMMTSVGLDAISHEWWHYNLPDGKNDKYPMPSLVYEDYE